MTEIEQIRDILKIAFRTTNPWKFPGDDGGYYENGWNDCLKELKKRQKSYIKDLTTFIENMNDQL